MATDFQSALRRAVARCDAALDTLLPTGGRLAAAMRYAALGPGKRLRPFLVMECAALFDADPTGADRVAAALECIHAYSLVHDDLPAMDDDNLRRGRKTAHIAFDEATAILAGDGLLTLAFEIISDVHTHPDPHVRGELVHRLAHSAGAGGMVGGQMLDLAAETEPITDAADIIRIQRLKTGALFTFACEAGAMIGGGDRQAILALKAFAANLGLAFQIHDDVLDETATTETLGKATGKDAGRGKATFVPLLGLEAARAKAAFLIDDAVDALAPFGSAATPLRGAARFVISREK